jgi:hypothetical protein
MDCQILTADNQTQLSLVFTASPTGTESHEKMGLLSVFGSP